MKVSQPHPFGGKSIDLGSPKVGVAETADSRIPHVIDHHNDKIRFVGTCSLGQCNQRDQ
jgi:hypothetical protein